MINLKDYGYIETEGTPDGLGGGRVSRAVIPGRVTEFRRNRYTVMTERGEADAVLKGAFVHEAVVREDLPCVGDFVWLEFNESGVSRISGLLPRHSKFSRSDFSGHGYAHIKANREQIVATNFDYVFIVTSLNRDFRVNRILRYLTQARASGGTPVVILTKADLCEDFSAEVEEVRGAAPGVPVHAVSAHTGFGLDGLDEYLQPAKTVVFLGMSGVGKSSLLNALADREIMTVKETRGVDVSKGRHTTTHRQLIMLPCGAMVIDTPGMREIGLIDVDESIAEGFADVEELFSQCKFRDCGHESEPGCAVQKAIENGDLSRTRWEQYLTQRREDKYIDDKSAFLRERTAQYKVWSTQYRAELKSARKNGGKRK
ncbi:MAG: ribosome small subunit-dependent GTPase A [Defluviitaleaceae bacterium]|nr:ribosome small subunit-dependent GTPase A [Defluviitaleaceae bacterium]